ncbi:MAG TPA: hypothetical protein VK923_10625 [Euzebyales bacterium]|nr:hypothetical protein [Euzebyales bacterium]
MALVSLVYRRVVRPWHLRWGATQDEVERPMPGDELVPHPTLSATRGITIDASPADVWPWLVQMGGYTRAGWYSYDRFDNAGRASADRIIPELQDLRVGDVMLTSPTEGFVVRSIDPGRALVLDIENRGSRITSVPMLTPLPDGRTRMVFRIRAHFPPRHRLFGLAFDIGDFLFMGKQMLGIRERVERQRATGARSSSESTHHTGRTP